MRLDIFFFSALFSLVFLIVVLEFVRSKKLKEQYSLLWILVAGVMILLAIWRNLLESIASLLGIHYAPSLLFMMGILFSFALILHYATVLSRLHSQNVRLAQEIGILHKKIEDLNNQADRGMTVENSSADSV